MPAPRSLDLKILFNILFQHLAQCNAMKSSGQKVKVGAKSVYDLYFVLGGKAVQRESAIVWCLGGLSGQVHIFSRDLALGLTFGKPMFHLNITLYLKNLLRNTQVSDKSFPFCSSGSWLGGRVNWAVEKY